MPLLANKAPILGLGLSSPLSFEAGESSLSGQKELESSYLTRFTMSSSSRSELTATKEFECSRVSPITLEQQVTSPKGFSFLTQPPIASKQHVMSLIGIDQPPMVPIGPAEVAQDSHEQILPISAPSGSRWVPEVSPATLSEPVLTLNDSSVSELVSLPSLVASKEGDDDFVGSEGLVTFDFEGAQLPSPTIRDLVGDLFVSLNLYLWSFEKYLLASHKLEAGEAVSKVKFDKISFWIQIHGIPTMYQTKKVGYSIGATLGTVEKVNVNEKGVLSWKLHAYKGDDRYLDSSMQGSKGSFRRLESDSPYGL
nr:hypothetical protein CFP56_22933 [Quercus suber]